MWYRLTLIIIGSIGTILGLIPDYFKIGKYKKIILVFGILGILSGALINIDDILENHKKSTSGELDHHSNKTESEYDVRILYGGNSLKITSTELKVGKSINPFQIMFGIDYPLTLKVNDEKLFVSAKFRTQDKKLIAEIWENEWVVNQQNYFERNFNESALEIIDCYGNPFLQIELTNRNTIKIGGVILDQSQERVLIITADNCVMIGPGRLKKMGLNNALKLYEIKEIFQYPSTTHFGKRNE